MPKSKSPAGLSKRAFILSLPPEMPAKEVVEKAKEQGITIGEQYVWGVRSTAKQMDAKRGTKAGRRSNLSTRHASSSAEAEFRRLAIELGLGKSRALLHDTERRVAELIQGK